MLITYDSKTAGFNHGHAAIHTADLYSTIEITGPGKTSNYYADVVITYWSYRNSGGRYQVNGANRSEYHAAQAYA